jgi:uncharacterized lipoprotein YmbA
MGAQLDAVIQKLQDISTQTALIASQKQLLDGYKAEKQRFGDLVTQVKTDLDALTTANTAALKDLAQAIQQLP